MRLVFDDEVARWAADRLGFSRGFGACKAMGVIEGEALVGAVVFSGFNPEAGVMEMTAIGTTPRWMTRTVIRAAFGVVFDENKCQLALWRVSENNHRTIRLAERLGFVGHRIARLRGRDEDEIVFTLTDDAWRESRFS